MGISTVQSLPSSSATRGRGVHGAVHDLRADTCGHSGCHAAGPERGSLPGEGQQHPGTPCSAGSGLTATPGQVRPRDRQHSCGFAPFSFREWLYHSDHLRKRSPEDHSKSRATGKSREEQDTEDLFSTEGFTLMYKQLLTVSWEQQSSAL